MMGWVFGVTVYAASTVWASFMAGLAVGSLAAGVIGDRVRHPLRWFGVTELLIGATALATPAILSELQKIYVALYPSLPHALPALTAARLVIALLVLIVPTTLMGATLPLVIKGSEARGGSLGAHLGVLYGSNAIGAIVGTIAAGLYLIPGLGIHGTFLTAAAVNLAVGAGALVISALAPPRDSVAEARVRQTTPSSRLVPPKLAERLATEGGPVPPKLAERHASEGGLTDRQLLVVIAVFTLSGVISLAIEVVWFRVLTLFLRPTVYGFAVMLATILTGIALGSYVVTPLLERRLRWLSILAGLELAVGVAIVLSFQPLAYLPDLSNRLSPALSHVMPPYLVFPIAGSLLAILPTALLMGLAFPIGLRLWARGGRDTSAPADRTPGRSEEGTAGRIGTFYSLNVAGAIAGSLAAGFVLLPILGSRAAIILLGSLAFVSGLALLWVSELKTPARVAIALAASAVFGVAAWLSPDAFVQFVAQRYRQQDIVWREEGVEATVVVHKAANNELSLTVNGNHEASTGGVMTYVHRRIGHLPMALHPFARTALVIGIGGGATAGAVSVHDGVDVDIVELAGAVVRGARFFEAINYGVLSRPNVHLSVDDGRNYLMLTRRRYDVVTADVIHPIFAGSGNLYSREYFQLIRQVLNPGGLVLQWVAGTEAEYKTIARTFVSVFPETTVWVDGSLLVGSLQPLRLRRAEFDAKLGLPGRARGLHDLGIESFDKLVTTFVAGPDELRAYVGPGPILTDDRPLTEYFLSLPRDKNPDLSSLKGDVKRYVVGE
jgi:spermidine synthase